MLPSYVCRTCEAEDENINLQPLKSIVDKDNYSNKLLSDLLFEVTLINVNDDCQIQMPQHVCTTCTSELKNAYDFIVQARRTNELFLSFLESQCNYQFTTQIEDNMNSDVKRVTSVKLENNEEKEKLLNENIEDLYDITNKDREKHEFMEPLIMQDETNTSANINETFDPLIIKNNSVCVHQHPDADSSFDESDELPLKECKRKLENDILNLKSYKCNHCDKSFIRSQSLEKHMIKHRSKSEWFDCNQCDRKFYRKDLLRAHLIKEHDAPAKKRRVGNVRECQRAVEVDINRCKPNGCKIIQCMICLRKYMNFSTLRAHLMEHAKISALPERNELVAEVAESLYPDLENVAENQLFALIRKDLNEQCFTRFYSITNESGYELNLDSSETESDTNMEIDEYMSKDQRQSNYCCELCPAIFARKYEIFEHQRKEHDWLEAKHVCKRCTARFVNKDLLDHHLNRLCKNIEKRFICKKCPMRFRWRHNLNAHTKNHLNKTQAVKCSDCNRTFQDQRSLTIHMRSVHIDKSKLLQCQWCTRSFYSRDCLVKHLKRHNLSEQDMPLAECLIAATSKANGTKRIICKICNLNFSRIEQLRAHILMALKTNLSQHHSYDSLANYSITNELGFELHIDDSETDDDGDLVSRTKQKSNSNGPKYTCDLCQIKCHRKFQLCHHQQSLHSFGKLPYECDSCIFKSVSKDILEHHKLTQCLNTEKLLTCEKCKYKFMWPENLDLHMRIYHATTSDDKIKDNFVVSKNSKESAPQLQCPHCEKSYRQQARLNMHIKDVHIDGNRKKKEKAHRYLCSLCGLETQTNSKLIIHMRRHTGEKPFKCDVCGMAFTVRNEVEIHRRIHTGEKPFSCSICGKGFVRTGKLKTHMLSHSGLRPHKCSYCTMDFRYRHDLKAHLQKHVGDPEPLGENDK